MKGVTCKTEGNMYVYSFNSYTTMIGFFNMKRPSQVCICFDNQEKTLTASVPVSARTVRPTDEIPVETEDSVA